jgi:hypothetical protein
MSTDQLTAAGLREQAAATPNAITALELRVRALELEVAMLRERQIAPVVTVPAVAKKSTANKRARTRP